MRGHIYTADQGLPEKDLQELADLLAVELYGRLGPKVYLLDRNDIKELVQKFIDDLKPEDQKAVIWLIWDLFQEGMDLEFD